MDRMNTDGRTKKARKVTKGPRKTASGLEEVYGMETTRRANKEDWAEITDCARKATSSNPGSAEGVTEISVPDKGAQFLRSEEN